MYNFVYKINRMITSFLTIFRIRFLKVLQNLSLDDRKVSEHSPKSPEESGRFTELAEDFRETAEDISVINQQNKV